MNSGAEFPGIPKSELLARLAGGRAAQLTVVTPNQRLAAAVRRDFDASRIEKGLSSWETADVLPLAALVERLYEDALYSELAPQLPILLTSAQEQSLWEDIVRGSEAGRALASAPLAAALAREAWQVAHAWRLMPRLRGYPASDDARSFADWAWRYEGATRRERHTDRARLADAVAPHLAHGALRKPKTLVAYGFDILDAQQREFLAALGEQGVEVLACGPQPRASAARRVAFTSSRDEIRAAAAWARARLEADPRSHIGVVVPDLANSRNIVRRVFTQVMEPARALPGRPARTLPFDLSLGEPLSSYPLAAAAMLALELAGSANAAPLEFARASRPIRSPFIAGAKSELAQRARLDAELRKVCGPSIGVERLRRAIARLTAAGDRVPACPLLANRLARFVAIAKDRLRGAKRPAEWGKAISELLEAIGFPGERPPDSAEFQTLKKFHEAIAGFAALDRVAGRMRFEEACARLARIAADTLFQPEAPEVPIQVLGVLESAGLEFDHLWVMGLTEEAWPIPARPNPFIPVALQRSAGVPESSAAASLALDERITRGWMAAAREVVLSHALREDDRELAPSPLIRALPQSSPEGLALPAYEILRDTIRRARAEERTPDASAPALAAQGAIAGGTGVFKDQAACPFRAFAIHRLGAEGLEAPPPGLDAAGRGTLLHAMLAKIWEELKSKARLDALSGSELDALLASAAEHAVARMRSLRPDAIEGRFMELERARLAKLARAWLELERERPGFEVAAIESKRPVSFGGVTVYAKLDRMDRLDAGGHAVLDYKTGNASVGDWLGPRPDDPQLPLYAVSQGEPGGEAVAAVAFARIKVGEMAFRGIAREEGLVPGVGTVDKQRSGAARQYASWDDLLERWRGELESLGREFASGDARVDPKRGEQTCRYCGLEPLCRINERSPRSLGAGQGEE